MNNLTNILSISTGIGQESPKLPNSNNTTLTIKFSEVLWKGLYNVPKKAGLGFRYDIVYSIRTRTSFSTYNTFTSVLYSLSKL